MDSQTLIQRYLLGDLTEAEVAELDRLLEDNPELRREFALSAAVDTGLREISFERDIEPPEAVNQIQATIAPKPFVLATVASTAAAVVVMVTLGPAFLRAGLFDTAPVATLVSSENATWESSLPTMPGSELVPGAMKLVSGIATVRFRSGAELMMEAPANLVLISKMRASLDGGTAVVTVPEPAIGFVLETPNGFDVDHGTQFAVNVGGVGKPSDFEVIKGEISVHLSSTGEEVRLTDQQSASIAEQKLTSFDGQLAEQSLEDQPRVVRVGTNGRATSVIRNNKRKKACHPDLLIVKRGQSEKWDRRSMFSFDVSGVDLETAKAVRLRLNQVPSGIGFATRLPKVNRFAVYGLTNEAKYNWEIESLWEDAPGPDDGVLLGTFEIPRSVLRGSFGVENEKLLNFLRTHKTVPITLILVRETGQIKGEGPGLTHSFASYSHPEASGPILEFAFD